MADHRQGRRVGRRRRRRREEGVGGRRRGVREVEMETQEKRRRDGCQIASDVRGASEEGGARSQINEFMSSSMLQPACVRGGSIPARPTQGAAPSGNAAPVGA